jgi:starch phosphorylase
MRLKAARTLLVEPEIPAALAAVQDLAHNLYWTWNTELASVFDRIDSSLWRATGHNPVALLQQVPASTWSNLEADEGFRAQLSRAADTFTAYLGRAPLETVDGVGAESPVAYFSLEFAFTESLPTYSGGLGVLAGDHLKSASDLGLPLVGVGLFYHEGYFLQALAADGWQTERYSVVDVSVQPLAPARNAAGEEVSVEVPIDGRSLRAKVWKLSVGKVPLYLLDADIEGNSPDDRSLTARLYGGDNEMRIRQEMLLGIGGVRALRALGLNPAVCHMNEGHSSLLGLERIRTLMEEEHASFAEARVPVQAATAFTTHTAVAAGIDLFSPELVTHSLGEYARSMGLDDAGLLGLGRTHPDDPQEPFSMAMLGLRLSGFRNGVSKLHGRVSQRLWESAWPHLPLEEVPIDSVTNGVHLPTWVSHEMGDLYDRTIGPGWRDDPGHADWSKLRDIPPEELWRIHERQRERLVFRARSQHANALLSRGLSQTSPASGRPLDARALTVGFARRFAGYKRATLLFRDPDRLAAILNDPERPVQFIFAGKAHPRDEPAKALIREVVALSERPEFREKLILLEGYDLELARALVQGCDVWLNTPLRPLEASGTSGMKACANGAIHVSVRDGWWWEAYRPGAGWAVGRAELDDDPEAQDAFDAASIYDLFEDEIRQAFYERDADGVPQQWVSIMKASIEAYAPVFNTNRMVSEYAEKAYRPAATSWNLLRANGLAEAREQAHWSERVHSLWGGVKICGFDDEAGPRRWRVTAQVHPGELSPDELRVDAVSGAAAPDGGLVPESTVRLELASRADDGICTYTGAIPLETGGLRGFALRVTPTHPNLRDPLSTGLALWAGGA